MTSSTDLHDADDARWEQALRAVEHAFRAADGEREVALAERNALVAQALAAGWTHARIAAATGLTRGRIGQLAVGRNTAVSVRG